MAKPAVVGGFRRGDFIASGTYGVVFKAHEEKSPYRTVAMKEMAKPTSRKSCEAIEREIRILQELKHENVVAWYNAITTPDSYYVIMELCNGSDLHNYLRKHAKNRKLPEHAMRLFFEQVSNALAYLHSQDIIHRDLKPQNLLLHVRSGEDVGKALPEDIAVKLADFGFARYLDAEQLAATYCGSPQYMAPEVLFAQHYDGRADLWSLGVIMFQCFHGFPPFTANSPAELTQLYRAKTLEMRISSEASPHLKDLLRRVLRRKPDDRLSFEQFFRHPFLYSPVIESLQPGRPDWSIASETVLVPARRQSRSESVDSMPGGHSNSGSYTGSSAGSHGGEVHGSPYSERYFCPTAMGPPSLMRVGRHCSEPGTEIMEQSVEGGFSLVSQAPVWTPGTERRVSRFDPQYPSPGSSPHDHSPFRQAAASSGASPTMRIGPSSGQKPSTLPRQIRHNPRRVLRGASMEDGLYRRTSGGSSGSGHGTSHGSAGSGNPFYPASAGSAPRSGDAFYRTSTGSVPGTGDAFSRTSAGSAPGTGDAFYRTSTGSAPGSGNTFSTNLRVLSSRPRATSHSSSAESRDRIVSGLPGEAGVPDTRVGTNPSRVPAVIRDTFAPPPTPATSIRNLVPCQFAVSDPLNYESILNCPADHTATISVFSQSVTNEYATIPAPGDILKRLEVVSRRTAAVMELLNNRMHRMKAFTEETDIVQRASKHLALVETFNLSIMLCSYLESNLERVKGEIKCEYEAVTTKTRPLIKWMVKTYEKCIQKCQDLVKSVAMLSTTKEVSVTLLIYAFIVDKMKQTATQDMYNDSEAIAIDIYSSYVCAKDLAQFLLEVCDQQFLACASIHPQLSIFRQCLHWISRKMGARLQSLEEKFGHGLRARHLEDVPLTCLGKPYR